MGMKRNWDLYTQIGSLLFNFNYIDSKYEKGQPDECWNWIKGGVHRQGYGMVGGIRIDQDYKRFMTVAHRPLMMRKLGRELTHDDFVIKTCSNMKCCNPDHMILGDYSKKAQIMFANGRGPKQPGLKKAGIEYKQKREYKYSEEEITWLRDASTTEISEKYNISRVKAGQMRWAMRQGFKWLPWPNRKEKKVKEQK
jgi:hypothetical protein